MLTTPLWNDSVFLFNMKELGFRDIMNTNFKNFNCRAVFFLIFKCLEYILELITEKSLNIFIDSV